MQNKFEIVNCEQQSPEWFKARKGLMTASHATAIGNSGKGLETYIHEMMAEYYSSKDKEQFVSKDTERGNEYEPVAREIYEFERDVVVQEVGFLKRDDYVGASPDGLVDEDGGIEIKCVDDKNYFKYLRFGEDEIDSGYIWQIQMNLLITGRKWWDLIIYNPNFKKSMLVYRILPDQEKFEALEKGFAKGIEMIKQIKSVIENQ